MLNEELMAGSEKFFIHAYNNITIILFDFMKFKKNVEKFHEVD